MSELLRVVLVRLCECEGNVKELACRHGRLTELGRQEALATRARIISLGIRAWVAPDNSACLETAAIPFAGVPIQTMGEFSEPPHPKWAGLTLREIIERWPQEWEAYWNPKPGDADRVVIPEGESLRATFDRTIRGLGHLHSEYAGSGAVAIVTHGEVVRLLTVGLLGAPLEHLIRVRGRNGAVSVFDYDGQLATFECINDISHLTGVAPEDLWDCV